MKFINLESAIVTSIKSFIAYLRNSYGARKLKRIRREHGNSDRIPYVLQCGYEMNLRFNDCIAQTLLLWGKFEPEVSIAIFTLVKPGMTVLDVGANIGVHTLHLAKRVGVNGQVLAFEPNPVSLSELQNNISMNNIENVKVLDSALWKQDGEELFFFPKEGKEAMGGFRQNSQFQVARKSRVETARLDTILKQLEVEQVDFLKIDVEGAELEVLKGAGSLLDSDQRPPILYESASVNTTPYSYIPDDLSEFLITKGYIIEKIDDALFLALPNTTW